MTVHFVAPYYLEPKILFEMIDSVCAQTRDEWLLTVVDDQYPGTAAEDYIRQIGDPRIEYVRNEVNLGATENVTRSMSLGRGKYLVVLGADDALEPNYVDVVLGMFERHPNAIMAHPGVIVVDDNSKPHDPLPLADRVKIFAGRNAWKHSELDGPDALASLMNGNWLYVPAMAFRQDVVAGTTIRHDFGSIGDLGWVTDLLLKGGTLALDPTPVFRYRRHMASHSSNHAKDVIRFDEEKFFYLDAAKRLEAKGWTKAARAARLHVFSRLHAMQSALDALKGGDVKRTMALAKRGLS
ncbi:glycosyltransferase [Nocardia sp. NRRL S-836]|uniref:glycosyltransferase n=1 Tax=Nocardia sp. NRRL S-836 TaxID=1519492 RepID=UPI0006ADA293|nr:glycosyltransferase family 2 protein [Nocardia sp. NRRL S-836]